MSDFTDILLLGAGVTFLWINKDVILDALKIQPGPTGGGLWYKANGQTVAMPWGRKNSAKCGVSSDPDQSGGNRWETNVNGFMDVGYEVIMYVQIKAGSMCGAGGHVGLKHGGPNHSSGCSYKLPSGAPGNCGVTGTCCCWWDSGAHNDGKAYLEIERSHNKNCRTKEFGNIGKLDTGRPIGFRWHISKEGGGIRLIMWVDTSGRSGAGQWRQIYNILDTGQFMPKDYYSHITRDQNVEIRISDVSSNDIQMLYGPFARKIGGSVATQVSTDRFADLLVNPRFVV